MLEGRGKGDVGIADLGNCSECHLKSVRFERLDVNGCVFLKTPDVELLNVSMAHR